MQKDDYLTGQLKEIEIACNTKFVEIQKVIILLVLENVYLNGQLDEKVARLQKLKKERRAK